MKDAEDEAFDELAKRQGGGFKAKQAMAADKLWDKPSVAFDEWWNGDNDESTNPFRLESGAYWAWAGWKAALAQPAQEPVAWMNKHGACISAVFKEVEETAGEYTTPLYTAPPQREWVGLTDDDIFAAVKDLYGTAESAFIGRIDDIATARSIEAKLKERNHGT